VATGVAVAVAGGPDGVEVGVTEVATQLGNLNEPLVLLGSPLTLRLTLLLNPLTAVMFTV
jgi:hypothetical protein